MKGKLPVLNKNLLLGIEEDKLSLNELAMKLGEETFEVFKAVHKSDTQNIVEEALDTIQVSIDILDRMSQCGMDIGQALMRHQKKLIDRGWEVKKVIHIEY